MRIKLDENMPEALVPILSDMGHDTDTAPQEGLAGQDDDAVWNAAQQAARLLITQDLDFSDINKFVPGTHHGILLLRLRDPGRLALLQIVKTLFETEPVETWSGCLIVATERKVRVVCPPEQGE
jgi:predicted nuclease of predicted toxin-antitoxin system